MATADSVTMAKKKRKRGEHRWVWGWQLGGDQPNFGRGGVVFGSPGEGKFRLCEKGKGGGNKKQNQKIS